MIRAFKQTGNIKEKRVQRQMLSQTRIFRLFLATYLGCMMSTLSNCAVVTPKSPQEKVYEEWQEFVYHSSLLSEQQLLDEINILDSRLSGYSAATTFHSPNNPVNADIAEKDRLIGLQPKDKTKLELAYLLIIAEKIQSENNQKYLDLSKSLLSGISEESEYKDLANGLLTDVKRTQRELARSRVWRSFKELDLLEPSLLTQRKRTLEEQLGCCATVELLIRLAYLMSLPTVETSNGQLDPILKKLNALGTDPSEERHLYAGFSEILISKLILKQQLNLQKKQINDLQHQLDTLKNIDELMDENQHDLDSVIPK